MPVDRLSACYPKTRPGKQPMYRHAGPVVDIGTRQVAREENARLPGP